MGRYAIMAGNTATNIIEADAEFAASVGAVPVSGEVSRGWTLAGDTWSAPTPTVTVPAAVTMRQARRALHTASLLAAVEAAIDALSEPDKTAARIEWEYSSEVQRHNGFVAALAPALSLTEQQLDDLFVLAATL